MPDFRKEPTVQQLRQRSAELEHEHDDLDRAVVAAQKALEVAMTAAREGRRRHAHLMGQRSTVEDRARAVGRPKIEAALRTALRKHAGFAVALAESQRRLDAMREGVDDQYGLGLAYDGFDQAAASVRLFQPSCPLSPSSSC